MPSYAAVVRHAPSMSPLFLHLVRDPRASAYSWRQRRHESAHGQGREVARRGALGSTLRWDLLNLGAEAVRRSARPGRALTLRFEDFVAEPRAAVQRISAFVEERPRASPFLDTHTVHLGRHHTLAGNPARFSSGVVELSGDEEWRARQSAPARVAATAVGLPFLRRYGYPLRP